MATPVKKRRYMTEDSETNKTKTSYKASHITMCKELGKNPDKYLPVKIETTYTYPNGEVINSEWDETN